MNAMASRVFVFTKLKAGVSPADYEAWVRSGDYPIARAQEPILGYEVYRAAERLLAETPELPYDYVEVIDVTDVPSYLAAAGTEEMQQMLGEWAERIGDFVAFSSDLVA
jgi:hypothetical protein